MAQPVDVEVGNKVAAPVEREKDEGTIRTTRYLPHDPMMRDGELMRVISCQRHI
jgi:hypothetical protein